MTTAPVILGLLQNQWARDPQRVRETFARQPDQRHMLIRRMLARSLSGRRLKRALGPWFDIITWEEASPEITATSSESPPPDPAHVQAVIDKIKPCLVFAFGRQAQQCMLTVGGPGVMGLPHPASRDAHARKRLSDMRKILDRKFPN